MTAEYPLPPGSSLVFDRDGVETPTPPRVEAESAPVVDPAVGRVGSVVSVETTRRAGRDYLVLVLEIDDDSAIAAATRDGGVF